MAPVHGNEAPTEIPSAPCYVWLSASNVLWPIFSFGLQVIMQVEMEKQTPLEFENGTDFFLFGLLSTWVE